MRLLYVVQAYGKEVVGGAETHCRLVATKMAQRGHHVEVLTSCATSYYDWANVYKEETHNLDGVTVNRLAVRAPRNHTLFGPLSGRVLDGHKPVPLFMQQMWTNDQGPEMTELPSWLWDRALEFDAVIFFTYLYSPTYLGLKATSGRVPTIMHPLAHDEPHLNLPLYRSIFKMPRGMLFSTPEEADLVRRKLNPTMRQSVIGIGAELGPVGDGERFRSNYGLQDFPYIVCVGRIDQHKGTHELFDQFVAYKQRNPGSLKLVYIGEEVEKLEKNDDVIVTGFVDRSLRDDAVAGALVSIHPSYFESFSMALTEIWVQSKPALVNAHCQVFNGQAHRSNGAIPYSGFAEFEEALNMILQDESLANQLGQNGRRYVEENYNWDLLLDRYERFVEQIPAV